MQVFLIQNLTVLLTLRKKSYLLTCLLTSSPNVILISDVWKVFPQIPNLKQYSFIIIALSMS